jgi:hypothetical protein
LFTGDQSNKALLLCKSTVGFAFSRLYGFAMKTPLLPQLMRLPRKSPCNKEEPASQSTPNGAIAKRNGAFTKSMSADAISQPPAKFGVNTHRLAVNRMALT